jgi:hypothetical protein
MISDANRTARPSTSVLANHLVGETGCLRRCAMAARRDEAEGRRTARLKWSADKAKFVVPWSSEVQRIAASDCPAWSLVEPGRQVDRGVSKGAQ